MFAMKSSGDKENATILLIQVSVLFVHSSVFVWFVWCVSSISIFIGIGRCGCDKKGLERKGFCPFC